MNATPDIVTPAPRPHSVAGDVQLPPPAPGVRYVRLRWWGREGRIIIADDGLRDRVDRFFHWPMLILALCVLPLLVVEVFVLHGRPEHELIELRLACLGALAIIWLAFVIEYIVKITIAECRLEYARRNWLDVLIILMPVLRPLRIAYIAKTTRVFTLRGVGMKFIRLFCTFVLGMEATDRLLQRMGLKSEGSRKHPGQMTRHQLMDEVAQLRRRVDAWESWHEQSESHLLGQGFDPYGAAKPAAVKPTPPDGVESSDACGSPSPN